MANNCYVCQRPNTKYSCINCAVIICNVCSEPSNEDDVGYSEENYCVGKCEKCRTTTASVSLTALESEPPPQKKIKMGSKKQAELTSFFTRPQKQSVAKPTATSCETTRLSTDPETSKSQQDAKTKGVVRTVTIETVEKSWKTKQLARYDANIWLCYDIDGKYARNLRCNVCAKNEHRIKGMKYFNRTWISGCTNYRPSAAIDHAESEPHKEAMRLHSKKSGSTISKGKQKGGQINITSAVALLNENARNDLIRKFQVAYFVVKEELPLTKYEKILALEEMHGVQHENAYKHDRACGQFIDCIGDELCKQLSQDLARAKFFSVLWDGSTDSSAVEQEATFALYFDPSPDGDKVEVKTSFLSLHNLKHADADGVKESIINGLQSLGITEYQHKIVGMGADGATVNRGDKGGVKAKMCEDMPWLAFNWCLAHRLELRELKEINEMLLGEALDQGKGVKPVRASGTHWLSHKMTALRKYLEKFGIYITHLQNVVEDQSYQAADRAKVRGYIASWSSATTLVNLCFFLDVLSPVEKLSLSFQKESADPVTAVDALTKTFQKLNRLKEKSVREFPSVKFFLESLEEKENDETTYQNIQLKHVERALESMEMKKQEIISIVAGHLRTRLEDNDSEYILSIVQILNCEGWERTKEGDDGISQPDIEFADANVTLIYTKFRQPLTKAGLSCSLVQLINEWQDLVEYALAYLSAQSTHYLKTWRKIFNSPLAEERFKNKLSTAKVERLFSRLKRVKDNTRTSLKQERLENLLRIGEEGPPVKEFDALPAVKLWSEDKVRRPNKKISRTYKKRATRKNIHNDDDSDGKLS